MKTLERKALLRKTRETLHNRDRKIARMKDKLDALTVNNRVEVDEEVQKEVEEVIKES